MGKPLKPDPIDTKILEVLMSDGRASFRKIAQRTSLTTPTVSARIARMVKAGLIRRFVPILSAESIKRGVVTLVTLKVGSASIDRVASDLAKLDRVEDVYVTTGQGITLKVRLDDVHELQPFLKENVLSTSGIEVASSQIITNIVKEEPPSLLPSLLSMNLKCDYCHGEVASSRPYTVSAGPSHYYFCCRTCRKSYLAKYGSRLAKIRSGQGHRTLRS